ncbi:MAG: DNA-directed polymerase subunit beta, partial [Actinomycetota bacterium]|nr:DNA-directed polymerase subunit beta [Actinomycetota bacterium]
MAARSTSSQNPRITFAKIREPLEVPNLLDLQVSSFDWLVGNATWQA